MRRKGAKAWITTACLLLAGVVAGPATLAVTARPLVPHLVPMTSDGVTTVFFAFNSSWLDRKSREAVRLAAQNFISSGASSIQIVGHADQAGDPTYNLFLSHRRALAVVSTLKSYGVPSQSLSADWKGEFQPTVPSAGKPEAHNRRVTITIVK